MISENSFKEAVDNALTSYLEESMSYLNNFDPDDSIDFDDLRALLRFSQTLERYLENVKAFEVNIPEIDLSTLVNSMEEKKNKEYQDALESIQDRYNVWVSQREEQYAATLEEIEAAKRRSITPLQEKHALVLQYKESFSELLHKYGITASDIELSPDITAKDFETLVDVSLEICKDIQVKRFDKWRWLLQFFDQDESDIIAYFAFLVYLIAGYILFPAITPILLVMTLIQTHRVHKQIDRLRVVESLMCDVDFDKFIDKQEFQIPELNQNDLDEWYSNAVSELESPDAEIQRIRELSQSESLAKYTESEADELSKKLVDLKYNLILRITEKKEEVNNRIDELTSQIHDLGDVMNKSYVMDTNFILGMNEGVQEKEDLGLQNINFRGEYESMISRIQLFLYNTIMNVRAGALEVHLFDPESLGKDLPMLYHSDLADISHTEYKGFDAVKTVISDILKNSLGKLDGKSITEFNRDAEEKGMINQPYHIFLLLSGLPDKLDEDSSFMKFLEYSCHNGVIIYTVLDNVLPFCREVKGTEFTEPWVTIPNTELSQKVRDKWIYDLQNNKPKALDFCTFMDKYLPKEKWWQGNTISGIEIHPGLVNGDPGRPEVYSFGDANVHMLTGGATGSGKSVLVDCILQYMLHQYPPSELEIRLIDMKAVEARKYTKDNICMIPHVKLISGTEDGEYCASVMEDLYQEMIRRCNKLCKDYGVSKVEDMRKKFDDPSRSDYNKEVHVPRIALIIDEFQVLFDSSRLPQRTIDKIIARIISMVKLARAAGIHLWFTSQEMTGTIPKNVLENFSLRSALRCSTNTSNQLIGNGAAGTIREKAGWLYTNDTTGEHESANKLWKVPYAPNEDIRKMMAELNEFQQNSNEIHHHARYYDEKESVPVEKILTSYELDVNLQKPEVMLFGEKTVFDSKSENPVNFVIKRDLKQNIYMVANGKEDYTDLVNSFIYCITNKKDRPSLLLNCQDRDILNFLELDKFQPEGWEDFLDPMTEAADILSLLEDIVESKDGIPVNELKPTYIMCIGWERLDGIGVNDSYKLTDRLINIIRKLNMLHIHLIMINRDNTIPKSVQALFAYKICAKVDEKTANAVVNENTPTKFPPPTEDNEARFAMLFYENEYTKFKIYAGTYKNKFEERSY